MKLRVRTLKGLIREAMEDGKPKVVRAKKQRSLKTLRDLQQLSLAEVQQLVPLAAEAAANEGFQTFYVTESMGDPSFVLGEQEWDLMGLHGPFPGNEEDEEELAPWQWVPEEGNWRDTTRF